MNIKVYIFKLILVMVLLSFLSIGCNLGFWGEESGSISGKVLDNNNLTIPEAEIKTSPTTKTTTTDKNGYFNIEDVKKGDYTVIISKQGYQTKTVSCRVEGGLSFSCWGSTSNSYIEIHLTVN